MEPLSGWTRTTGSHSEIVPACSPSDVPKALASAGARGLLPRGLGRSYGDVAQNAGGLVLDMTRLTGIHDLDGVNGVVRAAGGTSFDELLRYVVPRGWFPPVTPGTRFVTLGGALANDVHGKNHHRDGGIGAHVMAFELVTPDGEHRRVTLADDPELFGATMGGLGLTGVITEVTLKLLRIGTSRMSVDTERVNDLDDLMARLSEGDHRYRYSVAWVDCLAGGRQLGRGVIARGDHAEPGELPSRERLDPLAYRARTLGLVPPGAPRLVRRAGVRAFNELWFRRAPREERARVMPLASFFYPLDALGGWNRLYGPRGFAQYQFVVPFGEEALVRAVLQHLRDSGSPSFLAVLKRFGPGRGMLSFPIPGWTLALDVPVGANGQRSLLQGFDGMVASAGGRVYLAKDARLRAGLLPDMYPELDRWRAVRERTDPGHILHSDLERRLGLGARRDVFSR